MAISAERFKYLDKETNVAIKQFTDLVDNQVYTKVSEVVETVLDKVKDAGELLKKVANSIKELKNMIMSGIKSVVDTIKKALDMALDAIGKLELPAFIKDLFGKLKETDTQGVKDFVQDLTNVGSSFLCDNLDFLKMFMLGYALNGNILAGLLTALMFNWLDRFCKPVSKEDQQSSTKVEQLEVMIPPKGMEMTTSNTFNNFSKSYTDFLKANQPLNLPATMDSNSVISSIVSGNIDTTIKNLRESEISSTTKSSLLNTINSTLSSHLPSSPEYKNLLSAKGKLTSLPLISSARREKSINFSNLSDQLGSMAKNLVKVDISNMNKFNMNELEKGLFDKVSEFKQNVTSNPDIHSRTLNSGSFTDFDFTTVLPTLTDEEATHLLAQEGSGKSHRLHDLHPTTNVFLEA